MYDRAKVVALLFVVMSISSAIYVSTSALNYLRLFPALDQIQFKVDKMSFDQINIAAQVSVGNPTDYSGLQVRSLTVTVSFFIQPDRNITLFTTPNELVATDRVSAPLGPSSVYSTSLHVLLSSQQAGSLTSLIMQYPGKLMASVQFRVDIVTFLVSVTGSVSFTQTQEIPLTSS